MKKKEILCKEVEKYEVNFKIAGDKKVRTLDRFSEEEMLKEVEDLERLGFVLVSIKQINSIILG